MYDQTEQIRRELLAEMGANPTEREYLEREVGQVWDTDELRKDFEVIQFLAPFVFVRRRSDGAEGTLEFQPRPRFYYSFTKS